MPASDPLVGRALSHYRILRRLGAGGMGVVYEAEDLNLGRHVAMKFLPDAFAQNTSRMTRFQKEARFLASLSHPNIAAIHGLEDSGDRQSLVMELVQGPTLAESIRSGPIPVEEALRIARQIAEALEYAHECGIIHRDLKPANIKIAHDDMVKVLDFGLAKAVQGEADSRDISDSPTITEMASESGVLMGTASYMSPEQAKGRPVDRRADIWAFGSVLYEMLTGRLAFEGETVADTLAAVLTANPDWSRLPPATPAQIRVLLHRCLQRDSKQRLQAIGEARITLEKVLFGAPELRNGPGAAIAVPVPVWRRTLPWALFVVALAAFVTLAFFRPHRQPRAAATMRFEVPLPESVSIVGNGVFALSPDGRQLAFYAEGSNGVYSLWVRAMDTLAARLLPGSESSEGLPIFWSPDSRYIAYYADGDLKKIDLTGDPAETVCTAPDGVFGGSWNRTGTIIFGSANGIRRVPADGGTASQMIVRDSPRDKTFAILPVLLPDGRHFLYLRRSNQAGSGAIYVGSLDAKPRQQPEKPLLATDYGVVYVPSSGNGPGQLLFLDNNGKLLAQSFDPSRLALVGTPATVAEGVGNTLSFGFFSAANNGALAYRAGSGGGSLELTLFDRQGKVLGTAGRPGFYADPSLSPDGTQAAVTLPDHPGERQRSLWLVDLSKGTTTRFTFGPANASAPIWTPDGKRIIFSSYQNDHSDLHQKPANGSAGESLLLKSNETKWATSVSLDGRFLMYQSERGTKADLWVLPLNGDQKPFLFLRTAFRERDGHFSPDGHWVAYVSNESGRDEVYVRKFTPSPSAADAGSGDKWQVSYGGGDHPEWSKNGKQLYYLTPDGQVMSVAVSLNPVFHAGAQQTLFRVSRNAINLGFGYFTTDGKRFLFLAPAHQSGLPPFTVVLNWQADLKK